MDDSKYLFPLDTRADDALAILLLQARARASRILEIWSIRTPLAMYAQLETIEPRIYSGARLDCVYALLGYNNSGGPTKDFYFSPSPPPPRLSWSRIFFVMTNATKVTCLPQYLPECMQMLYASFQNL